MIRFLVQQPNFPSSDNWVINAAIYAIMGLGLIVRWKWNDIKDKQAAVAPLSKQAAVAPLSGDVTAIIQQLSARITELERKVATYESKEIEYERRIADMQAERLKERAAQEFATEIVRMVFEIAVRYGGELSKGVNDNG